MVKTLIFHVEIVDFDASPFFPAEVVPPVMGMLANHSN